MKQERRKRLLNHLKNLYPETRVERKREELDRLATSYLIALTGYLPCVDFATGEGQLMANRITGLMGHIAEVQAGIDWHDTSPLQGVAEPSETPELATITDQERKEMTALITQYGIYVGQDTNMDDERIYYISHPARSGKAMALNEAEIYEIVQDIASELSGASHH